MRAVEAGAKEWHEAQMKLRARRDAMRAHVERTDPRNLLSRARTDNVDIEIDHGHDGDRRTFGIVIVLRFAYPLITSGRCGAATMLHISPNKKQKLF